MKRGKLFLALAFGAAAALARGPALAGPGDVVARFPSASLAPQDIAWDGRIYYVTSYLESDIQRYSADLTESLTPLPSPFQAQLGLTGIAYNEDPADPWLWVIEPFSREIRDLRPDGQPGQRSLRPVFEPVVNFGGQPVPRGMAFDPSGNNGAGSLYIAESVGSLVYEVELVDGVVLRRFGHPDDPDGFPGRGATAPSFSDVALIRGPGGVLDGLYVTGGRGPQSWVRRLTPDGLYTGLNIPLARAGGSVSGFLVQDFDPPAGPLVSPALIGVVDSSAEIVALEGSEEPLGEIFDVACAVEGRTVNLSWRNGSTYDEIEVQRDCRPRGVLPGDAHSFAESDLGPGLYRYILTGRRGPLLTRSVECVALVGGGRVLRSKIYDGRQPVDLAVDHTGLIFVSDYLDRKVYLYSEDFELQGVVEFPFFSEDDRITGLAASPLGTFFLYNSTTNQVLEVDLNSIPPLLLRTIPVLLPPDRLERAVVGGMTFDAGAPGRESALWFVELRHETVYSMGLDGRIRSSFPHPAALQVPRPPGAGFFNYMGGLSEAPPLDFRFLDLTSGTLFERDVKRIARVDASTGEVLEGHELPLDGVDLVAPTIFVGIQHARRLDGRPVLYAVTAAGPSSLIVELDATLPEPRPLTRVTARQEGRSDVVALAYSANDAYERILVDRDCQPLAEIPAGAFRPGVNEYLDRGAPPGFHRYDLRGVKGGIETAAATALVRVGPGAVLARSFAHPVASPVQLNRNPVDGSFLVASNSAGQSRSLFRFRPDLSFDAQLADVVPPEWDVATMAARPEGAGSVIHVIAWKRGDQLGGSQEFPMYVVSTDGALLDEFRVHPPVPANGFVVFPTGLSWDGVTGAFFYLERNSDTLVRMDREGKTLDLLPHPFPPAQSYVFNLGLTVDAENGGVFVTGAGPEDRRITTALQLTPKARLTGLEIPLGELSIGSVTGIALDGPDLVVTGVGAAAEIYRLQGFHPIPPPAELSCSARNRAVLISWRTDPAFDQVAVFRDGRQVALLPGDASSFEDTPPDRNRLLVYSVAGRVGGREGKNSFCEMPAAPAGFIRGDVDGSGRVQLTDAVGLLTFLFLSGARPACDDAADADDSGRLSITDPIRILGHLFLGDGDLPLPYPLPGEDQSSDELTCS